MQHQVAQYRNSSQISKVVFANELAIILSQQCQHTGLLSYAFAG